MPSDLSKFSCQCGHGLGWHQCKESLLPHATYECPIESIGHKKCIYAHKEIINRYNDFNWEIINDKPCSCERFASNNLEYMESLYAENTSL